MSELSEKEQWKAIQQGNRILFEVNFRKYYSPLCGFAYTKLQSSDIAEEIVQDVFVNLWDKRSVLDITYFKSYLYTSVNNSVLNHFKHEKVKREHKAEMKVVGEEATEDDTMEFTELQSKLAALVAAMPEQRQKVFKLAKMEGLKYKDIAEKLGVSIKTVENHMGKALSYLREHLQDFYVLLPLLLTFL